jgi:hypothetical protein
MMIEQWRNYFEVLLKSAFAHLPVHMDVDTFWNTDDMTKILRYDHVHPGMG